MKGLRQAAAAMVARACSYYGLVILAVAAACAASITVTLALRVASGLTLGLALFLTVKSRLALSRDVRKTELWSMLAPMDREFAERARRAVSVVLHDAWLRAAQISAGVAAALWALAIIGSLTFQPAAG